MSLTKVSYSMITGAPVNIKDFGAVGDGTTNDTAAIQAAIDFVVSSAIPGTVYFPAGTYKCTATINVNCGYVSCVSDRATLNFSTIGDIAAIKFAGGNAVSGQPYNQATCVFSGFKLTGPSTAVGSGLTFQTTSDPGPAHMIVRDCTITNFNNGVTFSNNSYLVTIEHSDIWGCYRCMYIPSGLTNAGENIRVNNSAFFNSQEGVRCEYGGSTLNFVGTSFDGLVSSFIIVSGQANFTGCHFEYGSVANTALNIAANCIVTCTGCFFLNSFASQNQYIVNNGYLSIYGGRISVADSATNVVYSTSRLVMLGCHFQSATTTPVTYTGNALIYLPNQGDEIVSSGTQIATSTTSTNGIFFGGATKSLTVLNTWVSLGVGTTNGLFTFRDQTLGGTAAFMADSVSGAASVQNNITGFEMNYGGVTGQMSIRVTSGTVPRSIAFTILKTGI
jgi:hypothetical protein